MKNSKSQTTLNEKDALQDMIGAEKQLMSLYAVALSEGSSKTVRKEFVANLTAVAGSQYELFAQMGARGYCAAVPAEKRLVDDVGTRFRKEQKSLKAR